MLAMVSALMSGVAVLNGAWRLFHGDLVGLVGVPIALVFWYWIGMGAWRRANRTRA